MGLSNELSCEAGSFFCFRLYPQGVFNQWFEALVPRTKTLGCVVCLTPQLFLPAYLHTNVGLPSPQSSALSVPPAAALPMLVLQLPPCRKSSTPGCPSPPLLPLWMNVSSLTPWLSGFHTVRFSVNSGCFKICCCPSFGCVRRHGPPSWPEVYSHTS